MDQPYLLTYDVLIKETDRVVLCCAWFESEEDMQDFIDGSDDIKVADKIEILGCRDIQ